MSTMTTGAFTLLGNTPPFVDKVVIQTKIKWTSIFKTIRATALGVCFFGIIRSLEKVKRTIEKE